MDDVRRANAAGARVLQPRRLVGDEDRLGITISAAEPVLERDQRVTVLEIDIENGILRWCGAQGCVQMLDLDIAHALELFPETLFTRLGVHNYRYLMHRRTR